MSWGATSFGTASAVEAAEGLSKTSWPLVYRWPGGSDLASTSIRWQRRSFAPAACFQLQPSHTKPCRSCTVSPTERFKAAAAATKARNWQVGVRLLQPKLQRKRPLAEACTIRQRHSIKGPEHLPHWLALVVHAMAGSLHMLQATHADHS